MESSPDVLLDIMYIIAYGEDIQQVKFEPEHSDFDVNAMWFFEDTMMDNKDNKSTLPNGGIGITSGLRATLGIISAESLTVRDQSPSLWFYVL